jgi:hypothetical protein
MEGSLSEELVREVVSENDELRVIGFHRVRVRLGRNDPPVEQFMRVPYGSRGLSWQAGRSPRDVQIIDRVVLTIMAPGSAHLAGEDTVEIEESEDEPEESDSDSQQSENDEQAYMVTDK